MASKLDGPRWKVRRALHGLEELGREMTAWSETKPYEVVQYQDPANNDHVWQARIYGEPPPVFGVLVGEIIHNLRSALDHMACLLPLEAGAERPDKPSFPVFDLREPDPLDKKRPCYTRDQRMGSVTPDVLRAVDRVQPYHGDEPALHPLRILHDLWNWDKHNAISVITASVIPPEIEGEVVKGHVKVANAGPIHDGQELVRFAHDGFTLANDKPEPMNLELGITAAFGPGGPAAGLLLGPVLGGLHNFVAVHVLPPLERLIAQAERG